MLDKLLEAADKSLLTHTRAKDEEALTRIVSKNIATANRVILRAANLRGAVNFMVCWECTQTKLLDHAACCILAASGGLSIETRPTARTRHHFSHAMNSHAACC